MAKPSKIKPLGGDTDWLRLLLIAESGWGKTVLAGTADTRTTAGGMKALFLASDPEGSSSALYQGSTAEEWPVSSIDDMTEAYRYLRDGGGSDDYQVVIIDSSGEVQKQIMQRVLEIEVKNKPGRDPDIPAIQDYQKAQLQFIRLVKQFNDLPMHVIWTAHPMRIEDPDGEIYYLPAIQGGRGDLAEQFKGYMKVAGYGVFQKVKKTGTDTVVQVRRLIVQPVGAYRGKDRTGSLGPHIDNPTIPKMLDIVQKAAAAQKASTGTRRPPAAARGVAGRSAPAKKVPAKRAAPAKKA